MNDDVFGDDDDDDEEESSSAAAEQKQQGSHFEQHNTINAGGTQLPGYLLEAVEKYVREYGFSDRNKRIPHSAIVMSEVSNISRQIYRPNNQSNAVAAMWKVLNEATEGQLEIEFKKIQLEERIIEYDYVSTFINRIYTEFEEHVEADGFEETTRLARMLMVYFDLLSFHHQYFLDEYLEFCMENGFEPNQTVLEERAYEHDAPWLTDNSVLYRIHNPENDQLKGSLAAYFNALIEGVAKFASSAVVVHDKANREKG